MLDDIKQFISFLALVFLFVYLPLAVIFGHQTALGVAVFHGILFYAMASANDDQSSFEETIEDQIEDQTELLPAQER